VIHSNLRAAAGLLIVLSGLAAGCQWLGQGMTQSDKLAEKRRQRADAFARSIDQQHEQADLVAARDLWQRGDHESCKRRLNELLTRNPEQLEARLLLAEVLLDENQAQEGIRVLKPAEAAHHDDARVQYTMGLLLDASGSQEGARSHYQTAARLEPGNEVYTVSYNEATTSANGIAAPGSRENKDLKESDPSVPPPLPDDAERAGDRLAPAATPQDFPLPVILPAATPPPAVADDRPGPQVVRQDFSNPPQIAPLPAITDATVGLPNPVAGTAGQAGSGAHTPALVSTPEPTTLSESASSPPMGPPEKLNAPWLPSFFPQTSRDDSPPQAPQGDRPLVAARSSTSDYAPRPELPMPMLLALPSSPNDAGVAAGANQPPMPTAPAAASQPSRLPRETAAAKNLQPEGVSPSLRLVVPAENSGAIGISDGFAEAAGVNRTAHTEPIDPAARAAAEDLLRQGAEALSAGKTDVAMAFFREAAASRPHDPQIPISAAVAALRQNHPEAAVDLLEAAASRFPKSAAVYRTLGAACYRRTDYRAAQSALKQALLLDKANPLSYFLMGCTLVKLGQQPAANECFRQAGLLDPKYAVPRQPGQMP
jgi:tetratricopeptide (TPR) repeat protein